MLRLSTRITWFFLLLSALAATSASAHAGGLTETSEIHQSQEGTSSESHQTIRARSGDTLKKIALRHGVPVTEIASLNGLSEDTRLRKGMRIRVPSSAAPSSGDAGQVVGNRITLSDGYSFEADEVWKDGDEIWFRKGKISQRLPGSVSSVRPIVKMKEPDVTPRSVDSTVAQKPESPEPPAPAVWIHLVGGARFRVDSVQETSDGAWYSRGKLSIFMERERIARIEREVPGAFPSGPTNRDWTSGNAWIDGLIRTNGARYGLDPYLIFLVIEHESHFRQRAVSPKGARGLMQLMPATARRLGVSDSFDPVQNIMGGSRYLKELMSMFGGRVDLVLASYNAGEGAVMKYGRAVPPYRETRNYVKQITRRYGQQENSTLKSNGNSGAASAP